MSLVRCTWRSSIRTRPRPPPARHQRFLALSTVNTYLFVALLDRPCLVPLAYVVTMAWTPLRKRSTCLLGSRALHSTMTARTEVLTCLTAVPSVRRGWSRGGPTFVATSPVRSRSFSVPRGALSWCTLIRGSTGTLLSFSLVNCCLWLSHSPWLDLLFRPELSWLPLRPGCQRQRWAVRAHPPPTSLLRSSTPEIGPPSASADSIQ